MFFPCVVILYFNLAPRYQNFFLVIASCFFYMWAIPVYILIMILVICVDYFAGMRIEQAQGPARKHWLLLSLIANIGILFFFKGYPVFQAVARWEHLDDSIIFWTTPFLPIGLSFHTFQAMSYTLEVYRGNQKAEKNFIHYSLYVLFFPQLVAGPIERPQHLLPQFHEEHRFEYGRVVQGLQLMLWGFFKKVAVADLLAVVVDQVYDYPHAYTGWVLILATVFSPSRSTSISRAIRTSPLAQRKFWVLS